MKKCHVITMVVAMFILLLSLRPLTGHVENLERRLKSDPDNPRILFELGRLEKDR